ncbi:MAG: alpha/beta fold hydrolase [Azoarcus sp.]|nr:alpha/beta fold hydrolase [Azoarcus sp.]
MLRVAVAFFGILVLVTGGLLACNAQRLFYWPVPGSGQRTPENAAGLSFEEVYFTSKDGTRLHGWFIPAVGETRGVVLHVHGNGGHVSFNLDPVLWLPAEHYAVFMFDYRGYGLSGNETPNPQALMEDTRAAIAYLKNRQDVDASRLLIFAQSLGGNNAIAALAHGGFDGIAGVVLDSTFYSYKTIANDRFPGGGILVSDDYSANRFIQRLAPIPLLLLHGDKDEIVPVEHSRKLFEAAGEPKQLIIIPGAVHLEALFRPEIRGKMLEFFDACLAG